MSRCPISQLRDVDQHEAEQERAQCDGVDPQLPWYNENVGIMSPRWVHGKASQREEFAEQMGY